MQDLYVGDIGDFGKYGLLRQFIQSGAALAVNWYRVIPKKPGKQEDGKFTNYLDLPMLYRHLDPTLFDTLRTIVKQDQDRRIACIEHSGLLQASFYTDPIGKDRDAWHARALLNTLNADTVFLDPDNGLESKTMHQRNQASEKHVKWGELKDYYDRGQNVILYQHRPQMMTKAQCIENTTHFQQVYLKADHLKLLEFPKYTNRFYFMFIHEKSKKIFERVCTYMAQNWHENGLCHEIF